MASANRKQKKAAKSQTEEIPESAGVGIDKGGQEESRFNRVTIIGKPHIEILVNNPGRTGPAIYAEQTRTAEGKPTYALAGLVDAIPDTPEPSDAEQTVESRQERRAKEQSAIPSKKMALEAPAQKSRKKRKEETEFVMATNAAAGKEIWATKAQVAKVNRVQRREREGAKAVDVFAQVGSLNPRKAATVPTCAMPFRGASDRSRGQTDVIESGRAATKGKGKAKFQDDDGDGYEDTNEAGQDDEAYL